MLDNGLGRLFLTLGYLEWVEGHQQCCVEAPHLGLFKLFLTREDVFSSTEAYGFLRSKLALEDAKKVSKDLRKVRR